MVLYNYDFAFIGGDMRQIYMVNELISKGHSVIIYGLSSDYLDNTCSLAPTLIEAVLSSKIIVLPIPITKDGIHIISNSQTTILLDELLNYITSEHSIYGGCLTESLLNTCVTYNIPYHDFMEQEEIILYNSIATAEGAIAEAITSSNINLHDSACLIMGYGRCGRTLAQKLKYLCKSTDVTARNKEQLAVAHSNLLGTVMLNVLQDSIDKYDFIFNTIPALVLTKDLIKKTKPSVIIIDISSNPGGVDFAYAKEINRHTNLYLGIPGKISPKSSGTFLNQHLLNHLGKK